MGIEFPSRTLLRIAYYYHQVKRLSADDPGNNPYGEPPYTSLEHRGMQIEFEVDYSQEYLLLNQGRVHVLNFNCPHHDYYHEDAAVMASQMQDFVRSLETASELG